MAKLGVNIDHVATIRQARNEEDPDPIIAAQICEKSGAHSIVAHLREDRRHIQDRDILVLRKIIKTRFNLEMSLAPRIVDIACAVRPDHVTIVPEKREEITTEGGLDVIKNSKKLKLAIGRLRKHKIGVSIFIAPEKKQVLACADLGVDMIELHTGKYAHAFADRSYKQELMGIASMSALGRKLKIVVNAGHGLNYENIIPVARIKDIEEFNIGHAIISRAVFVGLDRAVKEMGKLIK